MSDLISKKDTLAKFDPVSDWSAYQIIKGMPSAEKTGHWNFIGDQMFECSECKHIFTQRQLESWRTYTYESDFPSYCPNCGSYNGGE